MYEFQRFGTLIKYDGVPIYMNDVLLTDYKFPMWWPLNWMVAVLFVVLCIRDIFKKIWRKQK